MFRHLRSDTQSIGADIQGTSSDIHGLFSNTQSIDDISVILDAEGDWRAGDFFFGFNILRVF